jgi:hypothetical protein
MEASADDRKDNSSLTLHRISLPKSLAHVPLPTQKKEEAKKKPLITWRKDKTKKSELLAQVVQQNPHREDILAPFARIFQISDVLTESECACATRVALR